MATLDLLHRAGVPLTADHLRQGLENVRWPGRFEILRSEPLLIVDCAHNGDSAAKLAQALQDWFPGRRWTFIIGTSRDKDLGSILQALAPLAKRVLATQSRHERAMSSQKLAETASEILAQYGSASVPVDETSDAGAALALAFRELPVDPVCVTGSIFLVADAREVWALYTGRDVPDTDQPLAHGLTPLGPNGTAQHEVTGPTV
jgi:dihydrofolate synthase/folylpolyglutamate synthase